MKKHPFYSCDPCGEGSDTRNQILKGARGQAGEKGKQGAAGVPGKGSLVTGSIFTNTGPTASEVDGNDEGLLSDTLSILKTSGLDVDEIVTVKPTLDENDLSNIKTKIRLSNGLFNWIAKWLIPKLVPAADAAGKVLVSTGTLAGQFTWQALSASFFDKYKASSSSTISHSLGLKSFAVGPNLAWTAGVVARATSSIGYVEGPVVSYIEGALVINVDRFSGTGDSSSWVVNIGSRESLPAASGGAGNALVSNGVSYILQEVLLASLNPSKITIKSIPIGSWNMQTTPSLSVDLSAHVPDTSKVVSIECIVFHDSGFAGKLDLISSTFTVDGAIGFMNAGVLNLFRRSGGVFDSANFTTALNRGYITVKYLP